MEMLKMNKLGSVFCQKRSQYLFGGTFEENHPCCCSTLTD